MHRRATLHSLNHVAPTASAFSLRPPGPPFSLHTENTAHLHPSGLPASRTMDSLTNSSPQSDPRLQAATRSTGGGGPQAETEQNQGPSPDSGPQGL